MMRRIACVGDALRDGGTLLPYEGPIFTIGDAGHQVALIGGQARCEVCKSVGKIVKAGGPRRMNFMREVALDGDLVLCNCPMPQRIVATLAGETWYEDMGGVGLSLDDKTIFPSSEPKFDQQVQLLDEHTGEPLRRRRYRLVGELGAFGGYTDSNGMTERIVGDHPSTMKVEIFGEGA
jgi:hypothetical protein